MWTPGLNTKEKEGHETTGDGAYLLCQDKTKQAKQDDRVSKKKNEQYINAWAWAFTIVAY